MIEHAYFEGKGREQAGFIREAVGVATELPGSAPGIADATSTIISSSGSLAIFAAIAARQQHAVIIAPEP